MVKMQAIILADLAAFSHSRQPANQYARIRIT
jgi:hypothetical protein